MISVIIPACNEATVIEQNLRSFLDKSQKRNLEIIVVCNGCTDNTANIVRNMSSHFIVIEIEEPSKTAALNIGDQYASFFPRFYLDADLKISIVDLYKVVAALKKPNILAAAPEFSFNLEGVSWPVVKYYRVWRNMPYFDVGRIAGAFALSEEGRNRFDKFPDVISDDSYVRLHFSPTERVTVQEAKVTVNVPKRLKNLIKIKTRSHLGTFKLKREYPHLFNNENASPVLSLNRLLSANFLITEKIVYIYVSMIAKINSRLKNITGNKKWERDNSSR